MASIIFSDKAIKHLNYKNKDWIKTASNILPYVILVVILFHIFASVTTFGIFHNQIRIKYYIKVSILCNI